MSEPTPLITPAQAHDDKHKRAPHIPVRWDKQLEPDETKNQGIANTEPLPDTTVPAENTEEK